MNNRENISNENYNLVRSKSIKLNIQKPIQININKNILVNIKKYKKTKIIFFKGTTNEAIMYFNNINKYYKILVLNFANSHHVCGGYLKGSMAQEEELCRTIIDLFPSLAMLADRKKYYINFKWYKHVLYSSNLSLYRYDSIQSNGNYNFINPIKVSVITAAAPNLNTNIKLVEIFKKNPDKIFKTLYKIIKTIYLLPIYLNSINKERRINILILGAFGCGAFSPSNNVEKYIGIKYNKYIASIFASILIKIPNILYAYDYICFAIPPGDNYTTFKYVFINYKLI